MNNTYRSSNVETLKRMATTLISLGHAVGPVVVPENPWVDGNPYFSTNAPLRAISDARRAA